MYHFIIVYFELHDDVGPYSTLFSWRQYMPGPCSHRHAYCNGTRFYQPLLFIFIQKLLSLRKSPTIPLSCYSRSFEFCITSLLDALPSNHSAPFLWGMPKPAWCSQMRLMVIAGQPICPDYVRKLFKICRISCKYV